MGVAILGCGHCGVPVKCPFPVRLVKGSVQLYHLKYSFHSSYSAFWVGLARFSVGKQGSKCSRLICCCLCLGRAALQKRVMALLRRIEHPTAGNTEVCPWQQKHPSQAPTLNFRSLVLCICDQE